MFTAISITFLLLVVLVLFVVGIYLFISSLAYSEEDLMEQYYKDQENEP